MGDRERDDMMLQAASMYYLQDETMETIARRFDVSRSTVSRLIHQARATGLVQITVAPQGENGSRDRALLHDTFGVRCHVVSVNSASSDVQRLEQVARVAGRLVSGWMGPNMVLGIAWGTTISAVVGHFAARPVPGSVVVQLNGAGNPRTTGIPYAGAIITRAAEAFGAEMHHFPVPTFFDYAETKEAMWRERSVRSVLELQSCVDMAVFGVGSFTGSLGSHVYAGDYLDDDEIEMLRKDGVVGDICTVLLRADGTWADIAINSRGSGPSPDVLRRIERRVCVAAGLAKVPPLAGAIRAGAVTDLVADEYTVHAVAEALASGRGVRGPRGDAQRALARRRPVA